MRRNIMMKKLKAISIGVSVYFSLAFILPLNVYLVDRYLSWLGYVDMNTGVALIVVFVSSGLSVMVSETIIAEDTAKEDV
jgi:hypothetical protein